MTKFVQPVEPVPSNVAKTLRLSHDGYVCIGFWRKSEIPETGEPTNLQFARHRYERARAAEEFRMENSLPWPGHHVNPEMPEADRERVAAILDGAPVLCSYRGPSWDRLDPKKASNGNTDRQAAGYVWPSGLSTYVRKYGLQLDPKFIKSVERELMLERQKSQIDSQIAESRAEVLAAYNYPPPRKPFATR